MRILIVSDVTAFMRGGVPEETRQLASGLRSRGHDVAYCGDVPLLDHSLRHFPISLASVQGLQASVRAALITCQPDLVHVMAMSSRGLHALRPVLRGRPWLMTCHSLPPYERKLTALHASDKLHYLTRNLRFLPHGLAWRLLLTGRLIPNIVTHSRWVTDIVSRYGYPTARTREILLGSVAHAAPVRRPGMTPSPDAPTIVTVGGIAHTKGQHDAVRAIGLLRSDFPNVSYQIIGEVRDPSYLASLQSLIEAAGLSAHVSIRTNVDEQEKRDALSGADLYLQPSHEEGFCLAYIEAASQVSRLIGTDTGAIGRVSQGDPGMQVVPARNPSALAAAIRSLLRQPLSTDLMDRRINRLERDFSWSRYLNEHESLYQELVEADFVPQLSTV